MAYNRHLWSTNLALTTLDRLVDIICYIMFKSPYMPNLGSVLEEFDTRIAGPWMRRRWPIR